MYYFFFTRDLRRSVTRVNFPLLGGMHPQEECSHWCSSSEVGPTEENSQDPRQWRGCWRRRDWRRRRSLVGERLPRWRHQDSRGGLRLQGDSQEALTASFLPDSHVSSCPDRRRERGAHMRSSRMTGQSTATSPVIGAPWRRAHRAYGHLCLLADLANQADGMLGPVEDHWGWRKAPWEW